MFLLLNYLYDVAHFQLLAWPALQEWNDPRWKLPLHGPALRCKHPSGRFFFPQLLRLGKPRRSMPPSPFSRRKLPYLTRHRECYAMDEEGLPMHPTYLGIHFMELDSSLDACQDKVLYAAFRPWFRTPSRIQPSQFWVPPTHYMLK